MRMCSCGQDSAVTHVCGFPPTPIVDGLVERHGVTSKRGCPECGAVVECRVVDVGYHYRMTGYQFRKGPEHARTCRNWAAS